jgi:hypothetical protein
MRRTHCAARACAYLAARRRRTPGTACDMGSLHTGRVRCTSVDAVERVGFAYDVCCRTIRHLISCYLLVLRLVPLI